jgi:hypothetical protein
VSPADATSPERPKRLTLMAARLLAWLARPRADQVILWLGFGLLLASLDTGLAADDYLQTVMLDRPAPIPGFERSPLDIFRFCDARFAPALLRDGLFSWWDNPQAKLAFWRPISALTHAFDHALFRNVGWLMHLHSALWAGLLLLGVRALYRDLIKDRQLATLAFALYALDDARGWLVSWVAARNAAIATAFSVWALVAHLRERSGRLRTGGVLGPLLFSCALLAGEGSIAICAYLLAHALYLESGPLRARVVRLWPYAVTLVAWRLAYKWLGYGAYGSSLYVDPLSEPLAFLKMLAENGPILLGAQAGGMWSDAWNLLFVVPKLRAAVYVLTWACLGWLGWLIARRWQSSALLRFGVFGAVLAVVPATTAFPADRLLSWVAIGGSVALASLILPVLRREYPHHLPLEATVCVLLAVHSVSVIFLPSRARGTLVMRGPLDRAGAGIPSDPSIVDKTLIYVNPPFLPVAAYVPIERAALGIPRPRAQRILAIGTTALSIERVDLTRLRVRPQDGFLMDPVSKLMWNEQRPFRPGERIVQDDLQVRVISVTADHRPLEVEFEFARPLEDPSYVWRNWQGTHTGPFTPPKIGARTLLAGAEYLQTLLGMRLPIEVRM